MGVCINYTMAQERKHVKATLDRAEAVAREIEKIAPKMDLQEFSIRRLSDTALYIDMDGAETLAFDFMPYAQHVKEHPWREQFMRKELAEYIDADPKYHDYLIASGFCKTQYIKTLAEHKFIADLVRVVASYCEMARVYDEGDYYHTGRLEDAAEAIHGNAQVIASVFGALKNAGWNDTEIIKGGETQVKPPRARRARGSKTQ